MLVIAADSVETRYLHKALIEAAHSLECLHDVRDAMHVASNEAFDAVILHVNVLEDAAQVVAVARDLARHVQGATLAVIADLPEPTMRSALLWTGVDACFPRHFSFMELHERLRRLHARTKAHVAAQVHALRLDAESRAAVQGERRVALTRHEFLLIECLLRAREATIDRAQLTRYAWPDKDDINPASVNLVMSRLRKKLDAAHFEVCIDTVAGVGYRLTPLRAESGSLNNPSS